MSLLPRTSILAIAAVIDIALNARDGTVSSGTVARRLGLSLRALEHIFQRLVRCGIVKSRRGPNGGYSLSRTGITVEEILRAVGDVDKAEARPNAKLVQEVVLPALASAELIFSSALARINVEHLAASPDKRTSSLTGG